MLDNLLFYGFFIGQLVLISLVLPAKIAERIRYIRTNFPRSSYPKLYPCDEKSFHFSLGTFTRTNHVIFTAGLVLMASVCGWDVANPGYVSEAIPAGFFLLQVLPFLALEFSERSYLKAMKAANTTSKRTGDLVPRQLTNLVSPLLLLMAAVSLAAAIVLDIIFFWNSAHPLFGISPNTLIRVSTLLAVNGLFIGLGFFMLFGKKLDPHQSSKDRNLTAASSIKSFCFVSLTMSIYFIARITTDNFEAEFMKSAAMCAYCLLVAYFSIGVRLKDLNVDAIDFDVYRADEPNPSSMGS